MKPLPSSHIQEPPVQPSRLQRLLIKPGFWFFVALLLRLLYLLEQGGTSPLFYQPMLDEQEAVDSAMEILRGTTSKEPYFKAPGYSWILACVIGLTGDAWPWVIRGLQHLAGAALAGMAASLASLLTPAGKRRQLAIPIAGALAALYAPLIRLESNISLDFWVVFFQSSMLYYLCIWFGQRPLSWIPVLAAGFFVAAAWLTRPTITLALPFLALWLIVTARSQPSARRSSFKLAFLFLLPVLIAVSGIMMRNYVVSGDARAMPWQGGYSLYHANKPGATGRYYLQDRLADDSFANPTRYFAVDEFLASLPPADKAAFVKAPDYSRVNSWWFKKTLNVIKENPAAWLQLMGKKGIYLFTDKEIYNYEDFDLQRSLSPILRYLSGRFGIIFPLALASLASLPSLSRRRRNRHLLLWLYIVSFGGAVALYYVSGRMRMPIAFPLLPLAGCGASALLCGSLRSRAIAAILVVSGAILAWGDWWGVRSESMAHADLARMSNAAWYRGRNEQALALAEQAEAIAPGYPVIPRLKAQALYSLGRLHESKAAYEESVRLLGDDTSKRNLEVIKQDLATSPPR